MTDRLDDLNLYAQVMNRTAVVTEELCAIRADTEPAHIGTPSGQFDNQKWLEAERKELADKRYNLMDAITVEGAANYDA